MTVKPTTLLVNVTFAPGRDIADSFVDWARREYMPAATATPGCSSAMLLRVAAADTHDGSALTYAIQFRASSPEVAIGWLEERLQTLVGKFLNGRHPQLLPFFPSVMEVIDELQ